MAVPKEALSIHPKARANSKASVRAKTGAKAEPEDAEMDGSISILLMRAT